MHLKQNSNSNSPCSSICTFIRLDNAIVGHKYFKTGRSLISKRGSEPNSSVCLCGNHHKYVTHIHSNVSQWFCGVNILSPCSKWPKMPRLSNMFKITYLASARRDLNSSWSFSCPKCMIFSLYMMQNWKRYKVKDSLKKGTGILYDNVILQLCESSVHVDVLREVMGFSGCPTISMYNFVWLSKRKRKEKKKRGGGGSCMCKIKDSLYNES